MATASEQLATIKANILADLADLSDPTKRKPTYSIDGKSVSWGEYRKMLMDQLKDINTLINQEAPYVLKTQAMP